MTDAVYEARFVRSGLTVSCRGDETLLIAGRRAGLDLPFYCMRGVCRSCIQTVRGQVDVRGKTLTAEDRGHGLVLLCVGRPLGPVEIDA